MTTIRLLAVVCLWAAGLAWIRCGTLAFFVVRTPPPPSSLTRLHQANSHERPLISQSYQFSSLKSWFNSDDDVGVVTNWDSDQEEVELAQRMEKSHAVDYNKYWNTSSSITTDEKDLHSQKKIINKGIERNTRKRDKPHERRRGFGMPSGSGATSDGVRFSFPSVSQEKSSVGLAREKPVPNTHQMRSQWYVALDKSSGLQVPLNTSLAASKQAVDQTCAARLAAEAAFQVYPSLLKETNASLKSSSNGKKLTKPRRREKRTRQLASLLNVPIASAQQMIHRAPSLGSMDIAGTLPEKCIELSLLLQCTPLKFASIIRHCPTLLTFRVETITAKLVQLDNLLSGKSDNDKNATTVSVLSDNTDLVSWINFVSAPPLNVDVSESTLSIARRVPQLLASDVSGTLSERAKKLCSLLVGEGDMVGSAKEDDNDQEFVRVLKRCPELVFYNIEETIAPKLDQLDSLFDQPSAKLRQPSNSRRNAALREPRLLLYDVKKSLAPKMKLWRARVDDESSFTALLTRYPSLLMYSLGAAARLEYFHYRNKRKPDAYEARQLLMLSKTAVETWGEERGNCLFDSTPALLGGTISRRGRPHTGESAIEASRRRESRRAEQSWCAPNQLEELKVCELRKLLRENGGTPASKRKSQLISELHMLGYTTHINDEKNYRVESKDNTEEAKQPLLSYPQWIAMKLCTSCPLLWELCNGSTYSKYLSTQKAQTPSAGELEKLYGLALKWGINVTARSTANKINEPMLTTYQPE